MQIRRTIGGEIGTALAVLAIYLLTLLAPLHQARASQLAFQELGYATTATGWVLCTANGTSGDSDISIAKCPAAGIGKTEVVLPTLAVLPARLEPAAQAFADPSATARFVPQPIAPPSGPRGPPVLV